MSSVIALLECREARAREDLESWLEAVREAEGHAAAARRRVEHARIAREAVMRALAEEGGSPTRPVESGPGSESLQSKVDDSTSVTPAAFGGGADRDPRPPAWQPGVGGDVLSGVYRQVFAAVAAAPEPVTARRS